MGAKIVTINNKNFIKSEYIKVYPCASRGQIENTVNAGDTDPSETNPNTPINPEALLFTELNITKSSIGTGLKNAFIKGLGDEAAISIGNINYVSLVLNGYLFLIDKTIFSGTGAELTNSDLIAYINEKEVALGDEYLPNTATTRPAKTKILGTLYSTTTQVDNSTLTVTNENLDVNTDQGTIFTGLAFVTNLQDISYTVSLKIFDENSKFTISADEINNGSIDNSKLADGLINVGTSARNGITATIYQTSNSANSGHQFNLSLAGNVTTSTNYLTSAGTTVLDAAGSYRYSVGSFSDNTFADIIYFNDGIPKTLTTLSSTFNLGSYSQPIYINNGKLVPATSTIGTSSTPIYMSDGQLTAISYDWSASGWHAAESGVASKFNPLILNAGVFSVADNTYNLGGVATPIYMTNGALTQLTSTIGSQTSNTFTPTYLAGGTITAATADIGNYSTPIFMKSGILKTGDNNANVGSEVVASGTTPSSVTPIYLSKGTFNAASINLGGTARPIYMSNGALQALTSTVGGYNASSSTFSLIYLDNGTISAYTSDFILAKKELNFTTPSRPVGTLSFYGYGSTNLGTISAAVGIDITESVVDNATTFNISLVEATTSSRGGVTKIEVPTPYSTSGKDFYTKIMSTAQVPNKIWLPRYSAGTNITFTSAGTGIHNYNPAQTGETIHSAIYGGTWNLSQTLSSISKIYNNDADNYYLDLSAALPQLKLSDTIITGSYCSAKRYYGTYLGTTNSRFSQIYTTSVSASGEIRGNYFYATSDERLKKDITAFTYDLSITALPVYRYTFKDDPDQKPQIGCMAQDLQKLYPELVEEDENGYLAIQENKLVYLLLEEIKDLKARIEKLENK